MHRIIRMFTIAQQARRIESTRGNCDRKPRVSCVYYFKNRNPEFKEFKKQQKNKYPVFFFHFNIFSVF